LKNNHRKRWPFYKYGKLYNDDCYRNIVVYMLTSTINSCRDMLLCYTPILFSFSFFFLLRYRKNLSFSFSGMFSSYMSFDESNVYFFYFNYLRPTKCEFEDVFSLMLISYPRISEERKARKMLTNLICIKFSKSTNARSNFECFF